MAKNKKPLTTEELDARHDSGDDMSEHIDDSKSRRPALEIQRINVDFPRWMVDALDRESDRLGVTRQSIIKFLIGNRLEDLSRVANSKTAYHQANEE